MQHTSMPRMEKNMASAILRAIRARRKKTIIKAASPPSPALSAKLRPVTFADFDSVMALRRFAGWSEDSRANWGRLWRHNPALERVQFEMPMGWVLEAQGQVVAYLGNIPLLYRYGERSLIAATGSALVVEQEYRASTISLNAAFYSQKGVDLFLTTTAVEAVGRIARAFRCLPLPQPDYDSMLFWVLQPKPFARVLMKKLELDSRIAASFIAFGIRADRLLKRRWPTGRSSNMEIRNISVPEIGNEFDVLWKEKLYEPPRLLAQRDSATLRWHFDIAGDKGSGRVLCCYQHSKLLGYAIVRHEAPNSENGLRRSIIADMLAKDDDPAVLKALWIAVYQNAKQQESHILEVLGFPPKVRQISSEWHPYVRKYPACPFYYKAPDRNLHELLSNEKAWYASPFDGDTTLWGFGG